MILLAFAIGLGVAGAAMLLALYLCRQRIAALEVWSREHYHCLGAGRTTTPLRDAVPMASAGPATRLLERVRAGPVPGYLPGAVPPPKGEAEIATVRNLLAQRDHELELVRQELVLAQQERDAAHVRAQIRIDQVRNARDLGIVRYMDERDDANKRAERAAAETATVRNLLAQREHELEQARREVEHQRRERDAWQKSSQENEDLLAEAVSAFDADWEWSSIKTPRAAVDVIVAALGRGAEAELELLAAQRVLIDLDRWLANTNHPAEHPWRMSIAGVLSRLGGRDRAVPPPPQPPANVEVREDQKP